MENPIKMDDLGGKPTRETSKDPFPDHTLPVMLHVHSLQAGVCIWYGSMWTQKKSLLLSSVCSYTLQLFTIVGGWTNRPNWKICSSNWIISPTVGLKIKNVWNHQLDLKLTYSQHPKKRLFWCTRILWWLAPKRQHFGPEVLMSSKWFPNCFAANFFQTTLAHAPRNLLVVERHLLRILTSGTTKMDQDWRNKKQLWTLKAVMRKSWKKNL